jgi:hypothetical protein
LYTQKYQHKHFFLSTSLSLSVSSFSLSFSPFSSPLSVPPLLFSLSSLLSISLFPISPFLSFQRFLRKFPQKKGGEGGNKLRGNVDISTKREAATAEEKKRAKPAKGEKPSERKGVAKDPTWPSAANWPF